MFQIVRLELSDNGNVINREEIGEHHFGRAPAGSGAGRSAQSMHL
jgi:hypothetical protein